MYLSLPKLCEDYTEKTGLTVSAVGSMDMLACCAHAVCAPGMMGEQVDREVEQQADAIRSGHLQVVAVLDGDVILGRAEFTVRGGYLSLKSRSGQGGNSPPVRIMSAISEFGQAIDLGYHPTLLPMTEDQFLVDGDDPWTRPVEGRDLVIGFKESLDADPSPSAVTVSRHPPAVSALNLHIAPDRLDEIASIYEGVEEVELLIAALRSQAARIQELQERINRAVLALA